MIAASRARDRLAAPSPLAALSSGGMRLGVLVSRKRARVIAFLAAVVLAAGVVVAVMATQSAPASASQCSASYSVTKQ